MRLYSLKKRLRSRAQACMLDEKAKADPLHLVCLRAMIGSPKEMMRKDVIAEWKRICRSRNIPIPETGAVPVLKEADSKVRDAGIRWYTGSFPGDPDIIISVIGEESYQRHKSRVDHGMRMDMWEKCVRKRTAESIKFLVDAIEKYWITGTKKRKRARPDSEDEEWSLRRNRR